MIIVPLFGGIKVRLQRRTEHSRVRKVNFKSRLRSRTKEQNFLVIHTINLKLE